MKKLFAVATTTALDLTAAGAPAFAEGETINISGLFYLDRNGDHAYDAGDGIRAWGPGVRITNKDTNEKFDVKVGADGRYALHNLPKGPTYLVENQDMVNYASSKLGYSTTETVANGDFCCGAASSGTSRSSTPASPSETTTPTTTTTPPAVAKAGDNSGLASTGASPLGFIALGSLLLVAGAGVFLVARRRRS